MLFDPAPKDSRNDFFDREVEIERVESLSSPITLVLGLRRTGKSSIIRIALNELGLPSIYIDLRRFEDRGYINYRDFLIEVEREVNRLVRRYPSILDFLRSIEGISIMGNEVKLHWGGKRRLSFSQLLDALNDWAEDRVVLVFDEAQELIKMRGADLLYPLAYSFDNLRRVRFIISGSRMRMLYRYLRVDDPRSPLYGRAMNEVELLPFNRDMSMEFLRRGFEELKIQFSKYEEVYEELGGIPGWLTYFGYYYYQTRDYEKAMRRTIETARELIMEEFNNFLILRQTARERYLTIMRRVALECSTWSDIKRALEAHEGVGISDSEIHNYINNLLEASWIVKVGNVYCPAEKLIGKVFR